MADTPEAGPSRPKRARFHAQSSKDAAAMKVDNIDVERYAFSRGIEISAMERAMKASRDSGAQRAFQSLPRHLRRRAASHNIRRLPKRLRAKAKFEMLQDQAKVLKKRKFRQLPISKRRKLIRTTRLEILHGRQRDKAWLETHIWHAKRMKMLDTWGYRLAYTPTDKAFRPSYRASMHGVIVHDASYFQTLELKGSFEDITRLLAMFCDPTGIAPYAKRYSGGLRECPVDLYETKSYPSKFIGPATVIWDTPPPESAIPAPSHLRLVLLRFHPSILGAVSNMVQGSLWDLHAENGRRSGDLSANTEAAHSSTVATTFRSFCTFEITGPMATDTVKACLRPVVATSSAKLSAWKGLMPPAAVPTGTIFSLDVQDPRLHFPPHLSPSDRSHTKSAFLQPSSALAENVHFWDAAYRKSLIAPRYTKKDLDDRRAKNLVPGTRLAAGPDDNAIPIMLVQRSIGPEYLDKDFDKEQKRHSNKNAIFGWTLIVPSGWGSAFWHSLAFADTRVGGLRERAQQYFEAGCPSFPEDYACTHAFKIEIDKKAKDLSARWHRTPVAKRVNYAKLQTHSPWRPAFPEIIAKLADSLAELARSGMEAAEDPFKTEVALGTGLQNAPYLLGGQFLAKVLPQAAAWLSTQSNFISCLYQLQIMYKTQIENKFKKRRLPLEPSAFKARILDAFVKIRLDPLTRGSPKYNAIIYRLSESQIYMIRDQLRSGKYNGDIATLLEQQMQCDAEESGRLYPGRQPDMVDSDEEESQQEDQGGPQPESGVSHVFSIPPTDRIIGYVTSGNMSLARGKGQGVGAVSLFHLAQVMTMELSAMLTKSEPKLLVLFKNPASQFCRLATLEVLQ